MKRIFFAMIIFAASAAFNAEIRAQQTKSLEAASKKQTATVDEARNYDRLIDRYFDSLNEPDAKRRRALVEQIWTEKGVFAYPGQEVKGFAEIAADVERVQKRFPGAVVRRNSKIEIVHDNYIRFSWEFGAPGAKPIITGVDFAVVVNGKLELVVGFFDSVAPQAAKN